MKFEEITKTQKCYTKINGTEITIKVSGIRTETKQVLALEQDKEEYKWYEPKEYENWFVKKKIRWVPQVYYL